MRTIALVTDFGTKDWFVGAVKGVILSRVQNVQFLDITHEVPQGDIQAAAFILANMFGWVPEATIFVAIVDPGVGTDRPGIAVRTEPLNYLIGPDNGIFSWFLKRCKSWEARRIDNEKLLLKPIGTTFHGRDIFAPVAAWLAGGKSFEDIGPIMPAINTIPWPEPIFNSAFIEGEVVYIDRFGNAITNIPTEGLAADALLIADGPNIQIPIRNAYADVKPGSFVCVPASSGFWEIGVRNGSAASYGIKKGTKVRLVLRQKSS